MKPFTLIFFTIIIWFIGGCSVNTPKQPSKIFFDYDEIEYYFNNYDDEKLVELYDNKPKSAFDSIKEGVILGEIPNNVNDLSFIGELLKIGYNKSNLDTSKFTEIDEIFQEKEVEENDAAACIYVYRDILIFKKQGKVIGVAKVCFGCLANQIVGSTKNTVNFGQNGDYHKLEKLLHHESAHKN